MSATNALERRLPMMYEVITKLYPHDICSSHVGFQVLGLDGKSRIELVSCR